MVFRFAFIQPALLHKTSPLTSRFSREPPQPGLPATLPPHAGRLRDMASALTRLTGPRRTRGHAVRHEWTTGRGQRPLHCVDLGAARAAQGHEMNDAGARCENYWVGLSRPASDAPARTFSRALSSREEICAFAWSSSVSDVCCTVRSSPSTFSRAGPALPFMYSLRESRYFHTTRPVIATNRNCPSMCVQIGRAHV